MKYFSKKIGVNGAKATFYLQEANREIDLHRRSPMLVIVPGGAYFWTSWREEEPIALEFLSKGFSCAVFEYATEGLDYFQKANYDKREPVSAFPNPLVDLALLVSDIRSHADEWKILPDSINVMGFSAGGNLTAQLGSYWSATWLASLTKQCPENYRPNSICLCYAAYNLGDDERIHFAGLGSDQSPERLALINLEKANYGVMPPVFIWHTAADPLCDVNYCISFAEKLAAHQVPLEMHLYQQGKHGLALADLRTDSKADHSQSNGQASTWKRLYLGWLKENNLINLF